MRRARRALLLEQRRRRLGFQFELIPGGPPQVLERGWPRTPFQTSQLPRLPPRPEPGRPDPALVGVQQGMQILCAGFAERAREVEARRRGLARRRQLVEVILGRRERRRGHGVADVAVEAEDGGHLRKLRKFCRGVRAAGGRIAANITLYVHGDALKPLDRPSARWARGSLSEASTVGRLRSSLRRHQRSVPF